MNEFTGSTQEDWYEWAQAIRQDKTLSPSEQEELINGTPMPEEQYEERMDRDTK